jgi:hypothetical protein
VSPPCVASVIEVRDHITNRAGLTAAEPADSKPAKSSRLSRCGTACHPVARRLRGQRSSVWPSSQLSVSNVSHARNSAVTRASHSHVRRHVRTRVAASCRCDGRAAPPSPPTRSAQPSAPTPGAVRTRVGERTRSEPVAARLRHSRSLAQIAGREPRQVRHGPDLRPPERAGSHARGRRDLACRSPRRGGARALFTSARTRQRRSPARPRRPIAPPCGSGRLDRHDYSVFYRSVIRAIGTAAIKHA